jgi:hypothetical protein
MRRHAALNKPAIVPRRLLCLVVRAGAIASKAFGIAFGFCIRGDLATFFQTPGVVQSV